MQRRPLLLIHSALGSAPQLEPLQRALNGAFDAHPIELEGHGNTPSSGSQFEIPRFVAQVRGYIEAKSLGPAPIFGYSMGGYVALLLAAESPHLVAKVMTLATKFAWTPEGAAKETARLNPAKIREKVPAFASQLEERHRGAGGWEAVLAKTAAMMTALGDRPVVDAMVLASVRQPTRLLVGSKDNVVSVEETAAAARHLSNGDHIVLEGAPHPVEQVPLASLVQHFNEFLS